MKAPVRNHPLDGRSETSRYRSARRCVELLGWIALSRNGRSHVEAWSFVPHPHLRLSQPYRCPSTTLHGGEKMSHCRRLGIPVSTVAPNGFFPRKRRTHRWSQADEGDDAIDHNSLEEHTPSEITAIPCTNGEAVSSNHTATTTSNLSFTPSTATTTTSAHGSKVPTYRQLIIFASTTILIWLSEPLLSLVDTTVVGITQQNAIVQLASLGPSTTLIDSLLYLTYFLAIATTNLISKGIAVRDYRGLQRTTSHVLGVATLLGTVTTVIVWGAGGLVLRNMAGASGTPELLAFATRYAWIRASVAVSSVVGMVAQSFCLATLNTRTPAMAVLAASVTNLAGDLALAPRYGVQGAALATAAASLVSTSILMQAVRRKMQIWRRMEVQGDPSGGVNEIRVPEKLQYRDAAPAAENTTQIAIGNVEYDSSIQANDVLVATASTVPEMNPLSHQEIPLLSLPGRQDMLELVKLSGPIFFVILAKVACYGAMTIRCTDFGVVSLAAHNIMMRVFFFFGCFGDAVSQTAQSFMPATLYPKPSTKDFRGILKKLIVLAGVIAFWNCQVSTRILQSLGRYLSNDASIVAMMRDHAHYLGAALALHPFILLCEGTVIAARDFTTLVATYVVTLGIHFSILKFFCASFPAVWRTFFLFQGIRLFNFSTRVWRKQAAIRQEE